jgi:hypothetical protein
LNWKIEHGMEDSRILNRKQQILNGGKQNIEQKNNRIRIAGQNNFCLRKFLLTQDGSESYDQLLYSYLR